MPKDHTFKSNYVLLTISSRSAGLVQHRVIFNAGGGEVFASSQLLFTFTMG